MAEPGHESEKPESFSLIKKLLIGVAIWKVFLKGNRIDAITQSKEPAD